jgi:hypothetical protein
MRLTLRVVAAMALVTGCVSLARAQVVVSTTNGNVITYSETGYNSLMAGSLLLTNTTGVNGGQCAATSLINSFQFLQQAYPSIYGTSLTGGTSANTASGGTLQTALDNMINSGGTGSGFQGDVWNTKLNYINSVLANSTTFAAVTYAASNSARGAPYLNGTGGTPGFAQSQSGSVTFGVSNTSATSWSSFIQQQIKDGEDVEIGLRSHMTTVMGYQTTNGTLSALQIIDPNAPNTSQMIGVVQNGNLLQLTGLPTTYNTTSALSSLNIYYIFAESPVPEPTAFVAMAGMSVVMGVGLVYRRRKRRSSG